MLLHLVHSHTMFSDFAELRAVTALFDVGRWGMQKIGSVGPKNLQGAKNWAIRQYEPVGRSLEDLRRVAVFANGPNPDLPNVG